MKKALFCIRLLIQCIMMIKVVLTTNERYSNWVSFLNWGKKQGLTINGLMLNFTSNRNTFIANKDISFNQTIMTIPKDLLISFNQTLNLTSPKLISKWHQFNESSEASLIFPDPRLKQQAFIAIIESIALQKKKGRFYKKYKPYLSLIKDSYDNFPIFYTDDEIDFIINTHLGKYLFKAKISISNEYDYIITKLKIRIEQETYMIFRALGEAQTKIINDQQYIIPLPGYLQIRYKHYNTMDEFDEKSNALVYRARGDIKSGEVIEIETQLNDNTLLLMYYGITFESGIKGQFPIKILHRDLIIKLRITQESSYFNKTVDIAKENYLNKTIDIYKSLAKDLGRGESELNGYQLALENLNVYRIYYDYIKDGDYYRNILSPVKRVDIKRIVDSERVILDKRIKEVNAIIAKLTNDDL